MTDAPKQVRCNGCGEWYDARANACYLCDHPRPEKNVALINAEHANAVNANLSMHGNNALREKALAGQIPQNAKGVAPIDARMRQSGRPQVYNVPGARDLVNAYKRELRNAGYGE